MYSIRKRLSLILVLCSVIAVILSALFVNLAVDSTFNKYLTDNQNKRNERIVEYFEEIYKRDGKWTETSGQELQHEGYMSNYCLTLLDKNKKQIWGMDKNEIKNMSTNSNMEDGKGAGVYKTNTFEIKYGNEVVGYIEIGQFQPVLLSEEDVNFKRTINRNMVMSVLLTIIITVIVSMLFSKQFSHPVKEVSITSVELSRGNYEARSNSKTNVLEINDLINSINALGEKLKYQDSLRRRLVSDISHELRTPLNVLQNNLEAMIDGIFPATTERLVSLNDEVIRFGKLVSNLDVLKEFEDKQIAVNNTTLYLDELVSSVCQDFLVHSKSKNINLKFETEPGDKYAIFGDEDKLKQVFINVLSNAIKFTGKGGQIGVNLYYDKNNVFVKIKDNGIGIKEEDLPFVFERLYRGDKSRHEIEGSGIGLTIVKKIVELHSGVIDIESKEGIGTQVTLQFNKIKRQVNIR